MASFKNIILGIAIAIIFAFVVGYGILVFYGEEPQWNDYCNTNYGGPYAYAEKFPVQLVCNQTIDLTNKYNQCDREEGMAVPIYDNSTGCQIDVKCDSCQKDYNNARREYLRVLFLIAVIIGILGIIAGAVLFSVEAVGAGLMGGGLLSIIYGNVRYWEFLDKVMKFVLLFIGLLILIGLGYWINKKRK